MTNTESTTVRFYHISDVHLECHDTNTPIKLITPDDSLESVLVLNGDIGMVDNKSRTAQYDTFISVCSRLFKYVVLVRGSNERCGTDFNKIVDKLRGMCSQYDNVHFLENEDVILDDVKIFGAPFFGENHYKAYRASIRACSNSDPDIVVSHYLPSLNLLERSTGALSGGMGSEPLEAVLNGGLEDIKYWIYGHDHSKKTTMLGNTECRSYCRGYYGNEHYDEAIEIKAYFDFVKDWD